MAKNNRNFTKKQEENQKDTIQKLKSQIRRLKKENDELRSDNKTLRDAWGETEGFLQDYFEDKTLEEILKDNKGKKKVNKIQTNPLDKASSEREKSRLKWKKWKENLQRNDDEGN